MRYLSCFSGIEAASVAFNPIGWTCVGVAEIEPFPCAVLKHHYPKVPNLGNVLADDFIDRVIALKPDVLVGGPPCQDFSVAGLRAGLSGDRGNLSLRWVEIINAVRPLVAITENVPGWFSVSGGHAFGAFLGAIVGADSALVPPAQCGGRWTDAGMVDGPDGRATWRVLDAQYFGLAQRRRRVFVVSSPREDIDCAAILLEPESLRRNFAPRREAGQRPAPTIASRSTAGGGLGTDFDCDGGLIAGTLGGRSADHPSGLKSESDFMVPEIANPLTHRMHKGINTTMDEGQTMIAQAFKPPHFTRGKDGAPSDTFPPLSADADKGDQDPVVLAQVRPSFKDWYAATKDLGGSREEYDRLYGPDALSVDLQNVALGGDTSGTLDTTRPSRGGGQAVLAFTCKDSGGDASEDMSPTLRGMSEVEGNANAGGQVAIAFESRVARNGRGGPEEICPPLKAQSGETGKGDSAPLVALSFSQNVRGEVRTSAGETALSSGGGKPGQGYPAVASFQHNGEDIADPVAANQARTYTHEGSRNFRLSNVAISNWAVRRLTPLECCRLQGFPDDYLDITFRGKVAADGNRYRALGNSMAVPVMSWLGKRIDTALKAGRTAEAQLPTRTLPQAPKSGAPRRARRAT